MSKRLAFLTLTACVVAIACRSGDLHHRVRIVIPATVPSIEAGVMRTSMWAHDPALADAPAAAVDHEVLSFRHQAGTTTTLHMVVRGIVEPRMRTYLTVQGFESAAGREELRLWDGREETGMPRSVVMRPIAGS